MAKSITPDDVMALLTEAVLAEPGQIRFTDTLAEVPGLDSSSAVYLMGEVLARYEVELSLDDFRASVTVNDFVNRLVAMVAAA